MMIVQPIRVLVVDDSTFVRHILAKNLNDLPEIAVVGEAVDGLDALEKIKALKPDVVTLDVQMPRLDGLETLQRIMAECPTPVVMVSALTQRGARTTIQALMRGAVDFVSKPDGIFDMSSVIDELAEKIKVAAGLSSSSLLAPSDISEVKATKVEPRLFRKGDPLIIIGASTGGPRALREVFSGLPAQLPAAIVVVQHMPLGFTQPLAQRLDENSPFSVQEAAHGDRLAHGLALVAPSGYHLQFEGGRRVVLDQGPRRNGVRPAVDVTMESAAMHYGSAVIGVVLTGMGFDGKEGAQAIKQAGGKVIAEHESTAVVYGMPRGVVAAGLADRVIPLPDVASTLVALIG